MPPMLNKDLTRFHAEFSSSKRKKGSANRKCNFKFMDENLYWCDFYMRFLCKYYCMVLSNFKEFSNRNLEFLLNVNFRTYLV